MSSISEVLTAVKLVREDQIRMNNLLEASGVIRNGIGANEVNFNDKYSVNLPLQTVEEFINFNKMLQSDSNCNKDFVRIPFTLIF